MAAAISFAGLASGKRIRDRDVAAERERCIKKIYSAQVHLTAEQFEALGAAIREGRK